MFTFDLKSGYHHVDIYKQHWDYFGARVPYNGTMSFVSFHLA